MVRNIRAKLILQLRSECLSGRTIAASQGMSALPESECIDPILKPAGVNE